jgi:hypothetical protein
MHILKTEPIMAYMILHSINLNNELKAYNMIKHLSKDDNIDHIFLFNYVSTELENMTILIFACKKSMNNIALFLLDEYGNQLILKHKDIYNKTALNYAVQNGLKNVAHKILLLEKTNKIES